MKRNKDMPLFIINTMFIIAILVAAVLLFTGVINADSDFKSKDKDILNNTPVPTSVPTPTAAPQPTPSPTQQLPQIHFSLYNIDENMLYNDDAETIYYAIINNETQLTLNSGNVDYVQKTIEDVLDILSNGYYKFFITRYNYTIGAGSAQIEFEYNQDAVDDYQQAVSKCEQIAADYDISNMTELDAAIAMHDYLIETIAYDSPTADNNVQGYAPAYAAYGAVCENLAVCDGYSQAYSMLLNIAGIETRHMSSDVLNHAWNMVQINSVWYHCDVTHDDPVPDIVNSIKYDYFLKNDQYMEEVDKNRILDNAPKANSISYHYEIYGNNSITVNSVEYSYKLEDGELLRYKLVSDEVVLSDYDVIAEDVQSWAWVPNQYEIIYNNISNGDIHSVDLDGNNDMYIGASDGFYILSVKKNRSSYMITCVRDLNGIPEDVKVVQ